MLFKALTVTMHAFALRQEFLEVQHLAKMFLLLAITDHIMFYNIYRLKLAPKYGRHTFFLQLFLVLPVQQSFLSSRSPIQQLSCLFSMKRKRNCRLLSSKLQSSTVTFWGCLDSAYLLYAHVDFVLVYWVPPQYMLLKLIGN